MYTEVNLDKASENTDDYQQILHFCKENNNISYYQFDASILHKVNLFALPENFDFNALNKTIDVIINTLPSIKRIFANPITRIKTSSEIRPVESVSVINNETVIHASVHSELWQNITREGLKPRKLLTQNYLDNYAIYENIFFAKLIDTILHFVSKNIRFLNSILFTSRDLTFNLLERENHILYFLSIGKLHTGYVRDFSKHDTAAKACLERLLFIDRVIRSRLASPVYKNCKNYNGKLKLKKTNVFRMHKDYHNIYLLLKWFSDTKQSDWEDSESVEIASSEGYRMFCTLLSIFAIGNFNFKFSEQEKIDFYNLNTECNFDGWNIKLETVECDGIKAIKYTVFKDVQYRIVLLPVTDIKNSNSKLDILKQRIEAEEYILATGTMEDKNSVFLSLFDIDSFRRIQQIILRAMIYSDKTRDECPFCSKPLTQRGKVYECDSCKTQILTLTCPETDIQYFATKIKNFTLKENTILPSSRASKLSIEKYTAAKMHFRNITEIASEDLDFICPKCSHIHTRNN